MPTRILILDTPNRELSELSRAFESIAADRGGRVLTITNGTVLLEEVEEPWDLLVLDQELGDGKTRGLVLLEEVRSKAPDLPVVVVAEEGDVDAATAAIEAGATDFLVRSHRLEDRVLTQVRKIRRIVHLVEENRTLASQNRQLLAAERSKYHIVGNSPQIREVIESVRRVAKVPRPVLIVGDRGTGKELVARAIHSASGSRGPFVAVNCAAFADSLVESELFGHERGAFTGADRKVPGKLEAASGGTLFLDEVGNMSLPFQRDILRVVEYRSFVRVGGTQELPFEGRIVAATNADLLAKIEAKEFLADLYDRLAFEVIRVPPLRERNGDVDVLATFFFEMFMREVPAFHGKTISSEALALLKSYGFPGNVRELKTIIERAVCHDTTNELTPEDIGPLTSSATAHGSGTLKEMVEAYERGLVLEALHRAHGNQAEAARQLGLSYHQIRYYAKKYLEA